MKWENGCGATVEDNNIRQKNHRFGNHDENQPTLFAIKMPFNSPVTSCDPYVQFDVVLDVIYGDLPFLPGLSSLITMAETVNHKFFKLALTINGK